MEWTQTLGTLTGMVVGLFTIWWRLDSKMERKFDTLDSKIENRFDTLDSKMERKFDTLDSKIENKFDTLDSKIENKFDTLDSKIENKFDTLDRKMDDLSAFLRDTVLEFKGEIGELRGAVRPHTPVQD